MPKNNHNRLARNKDSVGKADHHREPWASDEVEFLLVFFAEAKGNPKEEEGVAEALGRTIEACRQRFYEERSGRVKVTVTSKEVTTTTTVEYRGVHDEPDDQWWSADYYRK